jgi:putative membrane protein
MFCGGFGGYGAYGYGSLGGGWALMSMGFRLLIFVGVIILAYKLIKQFTNKPGDALNILDMAYAKGEISEEEYLKRKSALLRKN